LPHGFVAGSGLPKLAPRHWLASAGPWSCVCVWVFLSHDGNAQLTSIPENL
jgi:hypothetical protein